MKNKELTIAIVIVIIFSGVGIYNAKTQKPEVKSATVVVEETNPKIIQYQGVEGKSALELLKVSNQVVASESSLGVFVTEINGIKNTDEEFWLFYVNGKLGEVSADKYITKNDDKIEWRFEESPF